MGGAAVLRSSASPFVRFKRRTQATADRLITIKQPTAKLREFKVPATRRKASVATATAVATDVAINSVLLEVFTVFMFTSMTSSAATRHQAKVGIDGVTIVGDYLGCLLGDDALD